MNITIIWSHYLYPFFPNEKNLLVYKPKSLILTGISDKNIHILILISLINKIFENLQVSQHQETENTDSVNFYLFSFNENLPIKCINCRKG